MLMTRHAHTLINADLAYVKCKFEGMHHQHMVALFSTVETIILQREASMSQNLGTTPASAYTPKQRIIRVHIPFEFCQLPSMGSRCLTGCNIPTALVPGIVLVLKPPTACSQSVFSLPPCHGHQPLRATIVLCECLLQSPRPHFSLGQSPLLKPSVYLELPESAPSCCNGRFFISR